MAFVIAARIKEKENRKILPKKQKYKETNSFPDVGKSFFMERKSTEVSWGGRKAIGVDIKMEQKKGSFSFLMSSCI
jgi:hypothetical protein